MRKCQTSTFLQDSRCNILLVEDEIALQKATRYRDECPDLKHVVQYTGMPPHNMPDVLTWDQLLAKGEDLGDEELNDRLHQVGRSGNENHNLFM